jgi:hypothetical protein
MDQDPQLDPTTEATIDNVDTNNANDWPSVYNKYDNNPDNAVVDLPSFA